MKHFLFYLTVTSTLFFGGCKKGAADANSGPKAVEKIQPLTYLYDVNNGSGNPLIAVLGNDTDFGDKKPQFHQKFIGLIISEENAIFPLEEILKMEICTYIVDKGAKPLDPDEYWELAQKEKPICEKITESNYALVTKDVSINDIAPPLIAASGNPLDDENGYLIQYSKDYVTTNNKIVEKDKKQIQNSWKIMFGGYEDYDYRYRLTFDQLRHSEKGVLATILNDY